MREDPYIGWRGAYSGWKPKAREHSSWPIVAAAIVIVILAIEGLKYV